MASTGNEAAPPGQDPCGEFVENAFVCLQVRGPMECGCFGDISIFLDDFLSTTRENFLSTMAFVAPQSPTFCDAANDRVCEFYTTNQSCCCQAETEMARQCLVENVLSNELPMPLAEPCKSDCSPKVEEKSDGDSGGGSGGVVVAILFVLLLLGGGAGYYMWRRRKLQQQQGGKDETKDDEYDEDDEESSSADEDEEVFAVKEISCAFSDHSSSNSSDDETEDMERGIQGKPAPKIIPSKSSRPQAKQQPEDAKLESQESALSKTAELKKKRNAIETWNNAKKQGSTKSLLSFISTEGELKIIEEEDELEPIKESRRERKSRRVRNGDLARARSEGTLDISGDDEDIYQGGGTSKPDYFAMKALISKLEETSAGLNSRMEKYQEELARVAKEKESSKKRVKELDQDRQDMTMRLAQLEETQTDQAEKLQAADFDRSNAEKRLAGLEAKNEKLAAKLKKSRSASNLYAEPTLEHKSPRKERSSSKKRESRRELQRVASLSSLDNDDKKKKRSSSGKRRSSSRNRLSEPSKLEEMTTSWNPTSSRSLKA
jgi:hypothetical protein